MKAGPRLIIGTAVPNRIRAPLWGDTFFAEDLAKAMRHRGWHVAVKTRGELSRVKASDTDLVLYLRGTAPVPPLAVPHALWIISHPEVVQPHEIADAAHVFCASESLTSTIDATFLPQATDPGRFRPQPAQSDTPGAGRVLFVGNSRGQRRRAVDYALRAGIDLAVYGRKWRQAIPELQPEGRRIPNHRLAASYSAASIVLNDHWSDMAQAGIVSNRIFDALACGAHVVTDAVADMPVELREHLYVFDSFKEFKDAIEQALSLDPTQRGRKAETARAFVTEAHSFDHRSHVIHGALQGMGPH